MKKLRSTMLQQKHLYISVYIYVSEYISVGLLSLSHHFKNLIGKDCSEAIIEIPLPSPLKTKKDL